MARITNVEVKDVKRIEYVHLTPQGAVTVVGGDNEMGKSSLLDAVAMCLGGKKLCPAKPIRKGQKEAKVSVHLDGEESMLLPPCTVTRWFWERDDGTVKTEMEIVSDDGYRAPTPQGILEQLMGQAAFDPLAFSRLKPRDQVSQLAALVGLDFTKWDAERKLVYDERTLVNRDLRTLDAKLKDLPIDKEAPGSPIEIKGLMQELKGLRHKNQLRAAEAAAVDARQATRERRIEEIVNIERTIRSLEEELTQQHQRLSDCTKAVEAFDRETEKQRAALQAMPEYDETQLESKITEAGRLNQRFAYNQNRQEVVMQAAELRAQSQKLTAEIEAIDQGKAKANREAQWPIAGLGFTENGVTYNDLPFDQLSSAEQLKVSVAMGFAMNPKLKLLIIKDGSLLDENSLRQVSQLAESNKGQVFLERVGAGAECSIVIRNGKADQGGTARDTSDGTQDTPAAGEALEKVDAGREDGA